LNYRPDPVLALSSTTAYYNMHSQSLVNASESTFAGPFIGVNNRFRRHELTEEVRANSEFPGPLNFTAGALYEDGDLADHVTVLGNGVYAAQPAFSFLQPTLVDGITPVDIKTYSLFGQGRWNIVERLELAAGLRWTDEKRDESPFNLLTGAATLAPTPQIQSKNVSPEVTLTHKAADDLTVFGALKQGYKSGSFSIATPPVAGVDNSFGDERVRGGEAGLKSRLLERQLALNVAGYFYNYSGLQVGVISPPRNGVPIIQTVNAANARTYGLDLDAAYRPAAIGGLGVNGALNWNHARYLKFNNAPCWGGQLIAAGCNQNFIQNPPATGTTPDNPTNPANGHYTAQDLSGTPLIRAPEWQANLGFDYQFPLRNDYRLVFGNSNAISSRYVTFLAVDRPNNDNYQSAFVKIDLSLTLQGPGNRWEVAVIGKYLNDKVTSGNCVSSPLRGGALIATPSGSASRLAGIDPASCFADPGREVWLRFTVRPFAGHD
jgi:iron complex outermembrane receptor protein